MSTSSSRTDDLFYELAPFIQEYIFRQKWEALRPVQVSAIQAILHTPNHLLISSGTASGKTEAAMLPIVTELVQKPVASIGALYIGPLKALINDQFERIQAILDESQLPVQSWHGDVAQSKKERFLRVAQGILQITPESLEALLINRHADLQRLLGELRFVVIDEVHAFIGSDRGRQILCQLQRLQRYQSEPPRRVGLSATIGEPELAMQWLGSGTQREVTLITDTHAQREVALGLEHFAAASDPQGEDDSGLYEHIYAMCRRANKTLIFANQRAAVEEIVTHLRALAARQHTPDIYHVHHGSISKELREAAEEAMRDPSRPATVAATLTLELGIDIGKLDQVLQVNATHSVSSFVQRLGRSGRRGTPSQMFFYCQEKALDSTSALAELIPWNLLQTIAIIQLYLEEKWVEPPEIPHFPISLLYQQTLSILAAATELAPPQLAEQVLTLAPFQAITQDDYRTFLRHLLATQHLQPTESGTLIVGLEAEKLTNQYQFYATFEDRSGFRVVAGAQEIGVIASAPQVGENFQLAGFTWRVLTIDGNAKTIYVERGAGQAKNRWFGGGVTVHSRILQRMRRLLEEESDFTYLHKGARDRLQDARLLAREKGLVAQAILKSGDGNYLLLPWQGTKVVQTIGLFLRQAGLAVSDEHLPYAIEINGESSGVADEAGLRERMQQIVAAPPTAEALIQHLTPEELVRAKYDRYAPETLLRQAYLHDALDVDGALAALAALVK